MIVTKSRPPLDTSVFRNWPSVEDNPILSQDARYCFFKVRSGGSATGVGILKDIRSGQSFELGIAGNAIFTASGDRLFYLSQKDTLCIVTLKSNMTQKISNVTTFSLIMNNSGEYLIYLSRANELKIVHLASGHEFTLPHVVNYIVAKKGERVVAVQENADIDSLTSVKLIRICEDVVVPVWEGRAFVGEMVINDKGNRLAFLVEPADPGPGKRSLQYVDLTNDQSFLIDSAFFNRFDDQLFLNGISSFTDNEEDLLLRFEEMDNRTKINQAFPKLDIWSYNDIKLQSQQLNSLEARSYLACMSPKKRKLSRLQMDDELIGLDGVMKNGKIFFVSARGDSREANWNIKADEELIMVSAETGARDSLPVFNPGSTNLSPDGKYLVGMDKLWKELYCYEINSGRIKSLTTGIPSAMDGPDFKDNFDRPLFKYYRGIAFGGWLPDNKILAYCNEDIWVIDLTGASPSKKVTGGRKPYGKRQFRLMPFYDRNSFIKDSLIFVSSYDDKTKKWGIAIVNVLGSGPPGLLSEGPYYYECVVSGRSFDVAGNGKGFVIKRETAHSSPNYVFTTDFKEFINISHVYPERNYNWMTSELHAFKTLDGRFENGILYKPDDFSSGKKYPVIIHYYERMSQHLNKYYKPGGYGDNLGIAWFVSHGYLVFIPDIHYKMGYPGRSALNSVEGAANYLERFSWVNSRAIGIQGHSFGAYETNFVITHSRRFAAACSSSGVSNLISRYGSLSGDGASQQERSESSQQRIGATLWERPDLYIENSPIFYVDKVITPLLMVANKNDGNVPFSQGVEFFLALRRLGKIAWMLQYDGETHSVTQRKNYADYIFRMTQFFDHYLKKAQAPGWMVDGIPANRKQIDNGLNIKTGLNEIRPQLIRKDERKR